MSPWFWVIIVLFTIVSATMVLIILVQRPQGGGLTGAFGGAGGAGTETVFGGRVGDALTWATVMAFVLYLALAIALNLLDESRPAQTPPTAAAATAPVETTPPAPAGAPVPVTTEGGKGQVGITPPAPDDSEQ